ncbi:hypothetical protein NKH36_16615 [Mesorhizobium sp. M1312]|uniref:hypothetical protein n=1 Tax=unclassified Mesorhizobium TaxID=325217 RepID=UPI0033382381
MAKIETPIAGGAYIRNKDGSLERVEGTEPAPPPGTVPEAAQPAGTEEQSSIEPSTSKKGK